MLKRDSSLIVLTVLTFIVSIVIFSGILFLDIPTDIQGHIYGLKVVIRHHQFPIPPLYYFLLYLFSGFSLDTIALNKSAIFLLSFSVAMKYYYSVKLTEQLVIKQKNTPLLNLLIWLLLFSAPVLYNYRQMFIGRIPINLWHNSTTIFLIPFALLLFHHSLCFLKKSIPVKKDILLLVFFGFLNVLIKPSFLFAFLPAFIIMAFVIHGYQSRMFKSSLIIVFTIGVFVLLEYYTIYKMDILDSIRFKNDEKGIDIRPFFTMLYLSHNNIAALILNSGVSLLFPFIYLGLFYKEMKKDTDIQYTFWVFFFSLLIAVLVTEKGIMAYFGNFMWQLYVCNFILFLVLVKYGYEKVRILGVKNKKSIMIIAAFSLHLLSGLFYMFKLFYFKKYC